MSSFLAIRYNASVLKAEIEKDLEQFKDPNLEKPLLIGLMFMPQKEVELIGNFKIKKLFYDSKTGFEIGEIIELDHPTVWDRNNIPHQSRIEIKELNPIENNISKKENKDLQFWQNVEGYFDSNISPIKRLDFVLFSLTDLISILDQVDYVTLSGSKLDYGHGISQPIKLEDGSLKTTYPTLKLECERRETDTSDHSMFRLVNGIPCPTSWSFSFLTKLTRSELGIVKREIDTENKRDLSVRSDIDNNSPSLISEHVVTFFNSLNNQNEGQKTL